jgi:hypothetical protein
VALTVRLEAGAQRFDRPLSGSNVRYQRSPPKCPPGQGERAYSTPSVRGKPRSRGFCYLT